MAHLPPLSGLSLRSAPEPTAMISMPRAEQIDGRDRSEDEILREAYEYLLIRARAREAGRDDDNDWPPVYQSGFNVSFRGAHIDVDVWEHMESEARAQAMREVELAVPKMTRTHTHGAPPKEGDEWAFQEEHSKRVKTGATSADAAFVLDEMRHAPDPTGMPRMKAPPTKRDGPYDRPENPDVQMVRRNVDTEKADEQVARHMKLFTTPIAVLMLGHADDGPPHLATWYKWATETGRPGTKIFINHKATGWSIPDEYADVIVRLPHPEFEVRASEWGRASLTDVMINLLVYAHNNGAGGFSHYAYVSEDSVPLRRADNYKVPSCLVPGESRVVPYNNQQNRNQFLSMSEAIEAWQVANPPNADDEQLQNWWVPEYARDGEIGDGGYLDVDEERDDMMDEDGVAPEVDEESYKQPSEWVDSFWNKRRVIGSEDGPTQEEADQAVKAWDELHGEGGDDEESEDEEEVVGDHSPPLALTTLASTASSSRLEATPTPTPGT